jgi:hypothetical protein
MVRSILRFHKLRRYPLAGQLPKKILLIHAVFEGLAAIDEDDGDFIVELSAEIGVAIHVNFAPGETATARKLGETLFDDLTEVTSSARIQNDAAEFCHAAGILA